MSRHSKWAQIKHKKAITDQKRGAVFTKLIRMVTIAARQGGGDPEKNFRLRLAADKAKEENLPQSTIDRAIERATGADSQEQLDELLYEIIGPSGLAILVKAVTDNHNRTNSDIKHIVTKYGASIGTKNSVSWMFSHVGEVIIKKSATSLNEDDLMLVAIDAGAQDVQSRNDLYFVYTAVSDLASTQKKLQGQGITCQSTQIMYLPKNPIAITDQNIQRQLDELLQALEENDDVTEVFINAVRK